MNFILRKNKQTHWEKSLRQSYFNILINLKININTSQEGYKSSSYSEDKEEFGLSSYMFKSERTLAEVENLLKKLKQWWVKQESLCCKEGNDILDELFKGIISLCQLVLMSVTTDSGGISWTPATI